jgi:hypothetical protein
MELFKGIVGRTLARMGVVQHAVITKRTREKAVRRSVWPASNKDHST